jgi:hypothetical protein
MASVCPPYRVFLVLRGVFSGISVFGKIKLALPLYLDAVSGLPYSFQTIQSMLISLG